MFEALDNWWFASDLRTWAAIFCGLVGIYVLFRMLFLAILNAILSSDIYGQDDEYQNNNY